METQNGIRNILANHPLIPVATIHSIESVHGMTQQLVGQGIHCIEVTLRTSVAWDAIQTIKENYGEAFTVGVGTLVHAEQVARAVELGVDFMVSPGLNKPLIEAFTACKTPFIPGVATPSEIMEGIALGWDTFKFFPAHVFGGLKALKTYGQVFPEVRFCPTGGINEDSHLEFLELSNVISVGGSWMMP
jgi:2-dehydro-3-deoxyphosphogluconate aldolase/(4S)-4-hydroxy-2-oxoglutarate aldolase